MNLWRDGGRAVVAVGMARGRLLLGEIRDSLCISVYGSLEMSKAQKR